MKSLPDKSYKRYSKERSRSVTYGQSLLAEAEAFGHALRMLPERRVA
ncbi:MAG: hypothetical protein F6K26_23870 [Moorea sp. SIO2I5]|nr:hypothetical protein [Moorena sp. SIO2I5]